MQGIVGVFRDLDSTVDAVESLKKMRAGDITVYSPAPRHEIEHILAHGPSPVRRYTLIGGLLGAAFFRNDVPPALGGPSEPPPLPPQ